MYDAIIVGARCAGSPIALLLARKGYKVLAVDRSEFPSDVVSTHFCTPVAAMRLQEWGLLDEVLATGCPTGNPSNAANGREFPTPPSGGIEGFCPRRTLLDKILIDAARAAGAEVRENVSVRELLTEDGVVKGIRGMSAEGKEVEETAKLVIGADGENSFVARTVGAEEYDTRPGLTCGFYSYFSGVEWERPEVQLNSNRAFFLFPTNDDLVCLASEWPAGEFAEFKSDPLGNLLKTLDLDASLGMRARAGKIEEPMRGKLMGHAFHKKAHGPGWALAGDARFHKDPILGQGITDAFNDAAVLVEAIDAGFSGAKPMDEALAGYQAQRDAETGMMYEITHQFATLNPPEQLLDMMGAQPRETATA